MTLRDYSDCGWIPHKCHTANMDRKLPKVYSNKRTWLPLWWACTSSTLMRTLDKRAYGKISLEYLPLLRRAK